MGAAHGKVNELLRPRLADLEKEKRPVSEEELEALVQETLGEVQRYILERLLEFEPWIQDAEHAEEWVCPACGRSSKRTRDGNGNAVLDEVELVTTLGAVKWKAPQFYCKRCRRSFSPGAAVF